MFISCGKKDFNVAGRLAWWAVSVHLLHFSCTELEAPGACICIHKITNVSLILKMREIIFCFWANYSMGHFSGDFEGASTFWPLKCPTLRIHEILVWIRISGSIPLTNGSGPCYFRHLPSRSQQSFSASYFLKVQLHHFSKIKSHKEVTKQ